MAATGKISAEAVARAAMAAIRAHDKGAIPTANPNAHEPRRVTAHLGDFRVEAEFPPSSTETLLMIDRNGAPMLKARLEAGLEGRESDRQGRRRARRGLVRPIPGARSSAEAASLNAR